MHRAEGGSRNHKSGIDFFLLGAVLFFAVFGLARPALAWGPSVHLWIGDQVLEGAAAALPVVAALLRRHARSFLYGSLAPDFEVGKGSTGHEAHNHNWSTGRRLLERAESESGRAFALGYMAHLAADVIGHNHFVPNHLYRTFGSKKLGHAYWEVHADNLIEGPYAELAAALVAAPSEENDGLLGHVTVRGLIPFEAKKRIFCSFLRMANHSRARTFLDRVRPFSAQALRHEDVRDEIHLSLACVIEMLRDTTVPLLGRYDPIGARNIRLAKELRRESRRARTFSKGDVPFPIPAELRALRAHIEPGHLAKPTASVA
jgi:hypothetical protein